MEKELENLRTGAGEINLEIAIAETKHKKQIAKLNNNKYDIVFVDYHQEELLRELEKEGL